jgi:hypothetical protein
MKRLPKTLLTVLFLLFTTQLHAEDKSSKHALWKWGSDSSSGTKDSSMFKSTSGSLFKGPQLNLPKIQAFEAAKASTSRAFDTAKRTTGRMWNSTVDFLNPWEGKSPSSSKSKGSAWFFQKKDDSQPQYSTVNDFLRQEKPRF